MAIGMVAGFFGGALDETLMRVTEAFQILPKLLVAVVVVSLVGSGLANEILVIGLLSWPATARVIRGRVQVIRHEEFIAAAEMSGASWVRVLVRHATPNVLSFLLVSAALQVASAIMAEILPELSRPRRSAHPSWALLCSRASCSCRGLVAHDLSGIALAMTILGLNLMGDGLGSGRAGTGAAGGERTDPSIRDLRVAFPRRAAPSVTVVDGVGFDVMPGEIVGVVASRAPASP